MTNVFLNGYALNKDYTTKTGKIYRSVRCWFISPAEHGNKPYLFPKTGREGKAFYSPYIDMSLDDFVNCGLDKAILPAPVTDLSFDVYGNLRSVKVIPQ